MSDKPQRAARRRAASGSARLRKLLRDYERMSDTRLSDQRPIGGVNCCCCERIYRRPNAPADQTATAGMVRRDVGNLL